MEDKIPESFNNNTSEKETNKPVPKKEEHKPSPNKKENVILSEHEKIKNEGNEYYKNKNFLKALECYNKAIELAPTEILYYENKAAVYLEQKNYDAANETIETSLKIVNEHNI